MAELNFLYSVLSEILRLVVSVFLLRYLLQAVRADFRNPVAQFIVRFTNPVVLPLRRVLPPLGRTDTSSVAAVLVVQLAALLLLALLAGAGALSPGLLLADALTGLLAAVLGLYWMALLVYVILSWVNPGTYNPVGSLVAQLCAPLLNPLRRALPSLAGLDLAPFVAGLLILFLQQEVTVRIRPLLERLLA